MPTWLDRFSQMFRVYPVVGAELLHDERAARLTLDRRGFLKVGAAGAIAAALPSKAFSFPRVRRNFNNRTFIGEQLKGQSFAGDEICATIFEDCDLWGVDFRGALTLGTMFQGCDVRGANFDGHFGDVTMLHCLGDEAAYRSAMEGPATSQSGPMQFGGIVDNSDWRRDVWFADAAAERRFALLIRSGRLTHPVPIRESLNPPAALPARSR